MSTATRVFVARVAGLPVFDPLGDQVGRVRDVVVALRIGRDAPRVLGMAVEISSRKRIFVPIGRVTSIDPEAVDVRVKWADAATRSVAQEADAIVKLFGAGLLPASVALARLGYDAHDIADIRTARRAEALDGAGLDLKALLPGSS